MSSPPRKSPSITPSMPPMDPALQRQRLSQLAWMRVGFGALAGLINGFLSLDTLKLGVVNSNAYYGIYVGVLIYIGSYYFAKNNWVKGINPKDKNKLFTQGIGSFVMMFLFSWIAYNTYYACSFLASCHF